MTSSKALLIFAAGLLLAPFSPAQDSGAPGLDPDARMALRIDGVDVPTAQYGRWLLETQGSRLALPFAEGWKIIREAEAQGVPVSMAEINAVVENEIQRRVDGAFKGVRADWQGEVERLGGTLSGYLRQRRVELGPVLSATALTAKDRVVPENKIVRDWELVYGPEGRDLDLLLMKFQVEVLTPPEDAPEGQLERNRVRAWEEQRQRALAIRARVMAGEDFAELAAEHSDDPITRASAGRLDREFRRAGWSHPFVGEMLQMEVDEVSQPTFARGGWWLVKVLALEDTTLEEARPAMVARLLASGPEQDEVGRLWNELTEGLEFELNPELFNPDRTLEEGAPEPVALVIEGQPVGLTQFAEWMLATRGQGQARHFAEQWLVERRAREQGIEVSEAQIDDRAAEYVEWMINTGHNGSRESWLVYLKLSGRDSEHFMRELRAKKRIDLLVQELIFREREVTPDQVRRRWEQLYGERGRALNVRVITTNVPMPEITQDLTREELRVVISAQVEAAKERSADVHRRALAGEDFAALAARFSDDASTRSQGGRVPGHFRPEAWSDDVARAVLALDVGDLSEPLWTGRSWALFEVLGVEQRPFEEARAELAEELRTARPSGAEIAFYRNALISVVKMELLPGMHE